MMINGKYLTCERYAGRVYPGWRVSGRVDFSNFFNAVIDRAAFKSIKGYIDFARTAPDAKIIAGGG